MDGDRPITRAEDDRLGFSPVAEHLAQVIVDQAAKDGLVFGIEGKWGSGKSTLVNLTIDTLKRHSSAAPEVIEFSPWLVGARDDLLHHLFDELATAASRIDPIEVEADDEPPTWRDRLTKRFRSGSHYKLRRRERLKKQLGKKLKAFGSIAGGLSKLVKASGSVGVPYTEATSAASTISDFRLVSEVEENKPFAASPAPSSAPSDYFPGASSSLLMTWIGLSRARPAKCCV